MNNTFINIILEMFVLIFVITDGPSMTTPSSVGNFNLKIKTDIEISDLTATVKGPSGKVQSCTLKKQPDGHLGINIVYIWRL